MCCQSLSDFLTLTKCCCGIPLKMATYVTGALMLIYFTFLEVEDIQLIYIRYTTNDVEHLDRVNNNATPKVVMGSGLGVVAHIMISQDGFEMTEAYLESFNRGLIIAWIVINGFLITSTCLMLYGNAKGKSILLLQWLVVTATIGIGNVVDIILASILYFARSRSSTYHPFNDPFRWMLRLQFGMETCVICFGFVVVRSYYYSLTLPSIPVSFKTLKSQEITAEEEGETVINSSVVDV